jgi:AraC-like DNA-binding protein/effector-binding domain-containing protein
MQKRLQKIQPALAYAASHLDEDVSLAALARHAKISPFHLHRLFVETAGETPKQLTLRLRLGQAAVLLLLSDDSILDIALSCGFQSHEVFSRAFRRRFNMTPAEYRQQGFLNRVDASQAQAHALFVRKVAPCLGLYHINENSRLTINHMVYTFAKTELVPQPVIIGRKRVKRSDIAATIAQVLPHVFQFAQQRGIALTGHPFTRYIDVGPGLITMEAGMRVATPNQEPLRVDPSWTAGTGEADVRMDTLPGGPAAFTTHTGPYDNLPDAYAAAQEWIEAEGLTAAGPPWESYVTDPSEYPNPADWKTEVYWPVRT